MTKGRQAATQLTATGAGTALSLSGTIGNVLGVRHVNGTGTITAQGVGVVEWRASGGTAWFALASLGFGAVASDAVGRTVDLPDGANEVRINYTSPVGSTGHTLNYEAGTVTP